MYHSFIDIYRRWSKYYKTNIKCELARQYFRLFLPRAIILIALYNITIPILLYQIANNKKTENICYNIIIIIIIMEIILRRTGRKQNTSCVVESRFLQISSALEGPIRPKNTNEIILSIIQRTIHLPRFHISGLTNRWIIVHTSVSVPPGLCSLLPK